MGIWIVRRDYFKCSWDELLPGLQLSPYSHKAPGLLRVLIFTMGSGANK